MPGHNSSCRKEESWAPPPKPMSFVTLLIETDLPTATMPIGEWSRRIEAARKAAAIAFADPEAYVDVRPEVFRFARAMEQGLKDNDWKGGWSSATLTELFNKLNEEVDELFDAAMDRAASGVVRGEAADVGNLALMIADRLGALDA